MAIIKNRICSKCLVPKPLTKGFYRVTKDFKSGKEYFRRGCISCEHSYMKEVNKRKWVLEKPRVHARRINYVKYAGNKCVICKGVFHWSVYDYHHIDPSTKLCNVGTMITKFNVSESAVKAEIDKCLLLCSNCHRFLHWGGSDSNN